VDPLAQLFAATIRRHIDPSTNVVRYEPVPTPERERTYGMATVQRYAVEYTDRSGHRNMVTLLTKDAPLVERRVLHHHNREGQPGVPYSHTLDLATDGLATDGPAPVCQQDLTPDGAPVGEAVLRETAGRLAQIHHVNLERSHELPWLPRADRGYFAGGFVLGNCWEQWDETMRLEAFAREWGPQRPRLEAAAGRFLADMDRIWAEGDSLTLIHADLHHDQVLVHGGEPYLIDWGQARYGSFYLDLPDFFTPEQVGAYREAMAAVGHVILEEQFRQRYEMARRYVAFKYLGYTMWFSRTGGPALEHGRWELFETAVARI